MGASTAARPSKGCRLERHSRHRPCAVRFRFRLRLPLRRPRQDFALTVVVKLTEALETEGFGILTEIDVQTTTGQAWRERAVIWAALSNP